MNDISSIHINVRGCLHLRDESHSCLRQLSVTNLTGYVSSWSSFQRMEKMRGQEYARRTLDTFQSRWVVFRLSDWAGQSPQAVAWSGALHRTCTLLSLLWCALRVMYIRDSVLWSIVMCYKLNRHPSQSTPRIGRHAVMLLNSLGTLHQSWARRPPFRRCFWEFTPALLSSCAALHCAKFLSTTQYNLLH